MYQELIAFLNIIHCPHTSLFITSLDIFMLFLLIMSILSYYKMFVFTKEVIRKLFGDNYTKLLRNLHPYYSKTDIETKTHYYIPLYKQNNIPAINKIQGIKGNAISKEKIIPFFLKKLLSKDKNVHKYYLVLADSGMGKTTFLINLYLKYNKSWYWYSPFRLFKPNIKLFPLGHPNIFEDISKVKNKKNTILLLDAFDEDVAAIQNYNNRLNTILLKVNSFQKVIITCQTQLLLSDGELSKNSPYLSVGEKGEYQLQKYYISPFDKKDIRKYLRKRFFILRFFKRQKARKIVEKSPMLAIRPVVLDYIEDLIGSKKNFSFSFEVYETIIARWIPKEFNRFIVCGLSIKKSIYLSKSLNVFCQAFAIYLYQNRANNNSYSHLVSKNKYDQTSPFYHLQVLEENEKFQETMTATKSLINRNKTGYYNFLHKSILEYFLAKSFFNKPSFFNQFDFKGLATCKRFTKEMFFKKLQEGNTRGMLLLKGENKKVFLQSKKINSNSIDRIVYLEIDSIENIYAYMELLSLFTSLKTLVIKDHKKLKILHQLYIANYIHTINFKQLEQQKQLGPIKQAEQLENLQELSAWLTKLGQLNQQEWEERMEQLELEEWVGELEDQEQHTRWVKNELKKLQKLTILIAHKDREVIQQLNYINIFVKKMQFLEKQLPNCKIYY